MRTHAARSLLIRMPRLSPLLFAILTTALVASSTASATGSHHGCCGDWLPGISLADLVDPDLDMTFESEDERLSFGNFSAEVSGIAPSNLDFYRVIPTEEGFKLLSPLFSLFGKQSELDLRYEVEVADGFAIDAMGLSFFGGAIGRGSASGIEALVTSAGAEVAALAAGLEGPRSFGHTSDELSFDDLFTDLALSEVIGAHSDVGRCIHGGFVKALATGRAFSTTVAEVVPEVPEPATLSLLSLGLASLALRRRGRTSQRA